MIQILTPVGRLVQGDCFVGQTKDAEGNPLVVKNGPNMGQPRTDYFMALAIAKSDPGYAELWSTIQKEAKAEFPLLFDTNGNCINPKFAFKMTDGDSQIPNTKGRKPCDREGFPGHWVLNFSSGYAPKCYIKENGAYSLITDPNIIKRGYYIRISGSVKGNNSQQQPGIFLNHSMIEMVGYGDEIIIGPNATEVFGALPVQVMPSEVSITPVSADPSFMMDIPGSSVAAPQLPVTPAPDILQPDVKYTTDDGGQWTEIQLLQAGFTPKMIVALPKA